MSMAYPALPLSEHFQNVVYQYCQDILYTWTEVRILEKPLRSEPRFHALLWMNLEP